jgi:hypothetical protein
MLVSGILNSPLLVQASLSKTGIFIARTPEISARLRRTFYNALIDEGFIQGRRSARRKFTCDNRQSQNVILAEVISVVAITAKAAWATPSNLLDYPEENRLK